MCKYLKSFFNSFCLLFRKMFNRSNLNKVIFIFTFGLISRAFVNVIYNVYVFSGYLNKVYVIYYLFFSFLIIIIHEFVDFVTFLNVIDNIIIHIVGFIVRVLIFINKRIFFYKLEDIKISLPSVKKGFININKIVMHINESNASNASNEEFNNSGYDSDATISDTEDNRLRAVEEDNRREADSINGVREESVRRRDYMRGYHRNRNSRM